MVKGYMKYDVLRDAEKYTKVHKRKRLRHRVVTVLAGVVVFCTTYALILPAITLEKQCDIPEHTHTDACYAQVTSVEKRVPVCSAETLEIHRHTADCYDADGNPTCGYADFVVHSHDSRCYDEKGSLWCRCGAIWSAGSMSIRMPATQRLPCLPAAWKNPRNTGMTRTAMRRPGN